jgi:hypothetical protein
MEAPPIVYIVTTILALVGMETIGMDGMVIVLSWLVMALLLLSLIGEFAIQPARKRQCEDRHQRN